MWLFPQHSCDINQFFATLKIFEDMNGKIKDFSLQQNLLRLLKNKNLYNPQTVLNNVFDQSTANHKIDEVRFYGGIYETTNHKLHLSTYGELLLKYQNDLIKRNKIFIAMLFNLQFPHPNKNVRDINVYPIRILFEYLLDNNLNFKLTNIEIAYILYKLSTFDKSKYKEIYNEINSFRQLSDENKLAELSKSSSWFIINYVNCNYLFNILENLGIVICQKKQFGVLKSPKRVKPTNIIERTYLIHKDYIQFIKMCLNEMTPFDNVKEIIGLKDDWIRDVYNYVNPILFKEIEENDEKYTEFLQIPEMLKQCSANSHEWSKFEKFITKTFNLFDDVDAEDISGPGEPDTLAYFELENLRFVADAKSTNKKLGQINDGRLRIHRDKYNAKYTIIVTPSYRPSAVLDIKNTNTCIITSYCLADLVSKYIFYFFKHKQACSYQIFNDIITDNLGTDVSEKIYAVIDNAFGVSC